MAVPGPLKTCGSRWPAPEAAIVLIVPPYFGCAAAMATAEAAGAAVAAAAAGGAVVGATATGWPVQAARLTPASAAPPTKRRRPTRRLSQTFRLMGLFPPSSMLAHYIVPRKGTLRLVAYGE